MAIVHTTWISTSSTAWTTSANWSNGVPGSNSGNTYFAYFNNQGTANCTGNGTNNLNLTIFKEKSYTGNLGSITGGVFDYVRVTNGTTIHFEQPTANGGPSGSPTALFANDANATCSVYVYDSASQSGSTYYPPLILKGIVTVSQFGGSLGIAVEPGSTATATLDMSKGTGTVQPKAYIGYGATVSTINAETGTVVNASSNTVTTARIDGDAIYEYIGTGAHTTLTVGYGATCRYRGTGTISTLNVAGTFDRTADSRALTITDTNLYRGGAMLLDNGKPSSTTRSNAPAFVQCSMQDCRITMPIGERF